MKKINIALSSVIAAWGWLAVINYFVFGYLEDVFAFGYWWGQFRNVGSIVFFILVVIITLISLNQHRDVFKDQVNKTVLLVWLFLIISMVLTNLYLFNTNDELPFELQQPIFMVLSSLAIFATGRLKNIGLMTIGSVIFLLLSIWAFNVDFTTQKLLHSIGWFVSFVIPGHQQHLAKIM